MKPAHVPMVLVLFLLIVSVAHALTVVSNASDWRVAYILGIYAHKAGYGFIALDTPENAKDVFVYLIPRADEVVIYESRSKPVVPNYEGILRAQGFTRVRTVYVDDVYSLMFDIPRDWHIEGKGYVLVPDSAGEWVLSAGALAYAGDFYVYFLNNRTIDRIISTVPKDTKLYVIGYMGKRLRQAFPNAVYIATGSKVKDSIKIAEEYRKIKPFSQVYIMSGLFLYLPGNPGDLPSWTGFGMGPVLISRPDPEPIPEEIKKYISQDHIKAIEFVGSEFIRQWSSLREEVGGDKRVLVRIRVKYQNVPTRPFTNEYPMPALFLPSANVLIDVENVAALPQGVVFLRLRNRGSAAGYALPTYIEVNCGEDTFGLMPKEPVFVDAGDSTLVEYNLGVTIPQGTCTLYVEGRYGTDVDRMFEEFNKTFTFIPESVEDRSQIDITGVKYSPRLARFIIYVRNTGRVRTYVTVYLKGVLIDGVERDIKSSQVAVPPGASTKLYAKAYLTDADIMDNPTVHVVARFGEQPNLPVRVLSKDLPLEKETLTDIVVEFIEENAVLVGVIVLILVIILVLLVRK